MAGQPVKLDREEIVTLRLAFDLADAELLHEFLTRTLRITDDGLSCPIPEGACIIGRDLRDELAVATGRAGWDYPATPRERLLIAYARTNGAPPPPPPLVCLHCGGPVRWQTGAPGGSGGEWQHANPADGVTHYAVAVPPEGAVREGRTGAYGTPIPAGECGAYTADEGGEWMCRRPLDHGGQHAPQRIAQ